MAFVLTAVRVNNVILRIDFTDHARLRMTMRGVAETEVRDTIESPDEIRVGSVGKEQIAVRVYGSREVRVVFEESASDHIVVITVMKPKVRRSEMGKLA